MGASTLGGWGADTYRYELEVTMAKKEQAVEPMWMPRAEFRRVFRVDRTTFYRWPQRGIVPESAIDRAPGRHPYVDAAQVFPEQVSAMREFFERSGK